jgi:SAM-dependent methyltransferase
VDVSETRAISDELRRFIDEAPHAREPHIAFLRDAANSLPEGATVLDVGAGDAPYRELFAHLRYLTCDWENSIYEPERPPDIIAAADSIPLDDASLDGLVCTQVLEHVPEPWRVLEEFHRVLRPAGRLWLTTPLTWYLHEQPHDYYRYTSHGLRYLIDRAGFAEIEITPMNDSFSTIAQLVSHLGWMMGRQPDGHDDQRDLVGKTMAELAPLIASFSNYDIQWILPISFAATAVRPG